MQPRNRQVPWGRPRAEQPRQGPLSARQVSAVDCLAHLPMANSKQIKAGLGIARLKGDAPSYNIYTIQKVEPFLRDAGKNTFMH